MVSNLLDKTDSPNITVAKNKNPLYDLSKLEKIARGNQQFIDKMIQLFVDQTPKSIAELKIAYEKRDYTKLKAVAHKIKPSLETMGIDILRDEIRAIEKNPELLKSPEKAEKLISQIDTVINEVVNSLNQLHN